MDLTREEIEMLEYAALAIGYDTSFDPTFSVWNPLISDHHAFGLAVHLGIFLRTDFVTALSDLLGRGLERHLATRTAIVQVAAHIGKIKLNV